MEKRTAESEGAAVEQPLYENCLELGHGLIIAKVPLTSLREQDINARIMKTEMQKQLTDNIRKRRQLESLPFCALVDGKIEIISGHHRIRSAKDSGVIKDIYVLLDVTGLTRSQIAAKQLAHNAINGFDDQSTLKEIAKLINDVDDMLESYIGKDILGEPLAELETLIAPKVEFEWKNIVFTFLPHQVKDLDKLIEVLKAQNPDVIGYAEIDRHKDFIDALAKYQEFANIKNVGAAIHSMTRNTLQTFDEIGYEEGEWVQLTSLIGSSAIPKEAAEVIQQAIKKMVDSGDVNSNNKWRAIELLAADYLGGDE